MKSKNQCVTYFAIVGGDFDPSEMTKRLAIEPDQCWKASDIRRDGEPYGFSYWECGRCEKYNVYAEKQMEKTIAKLTKKIKVLNDIRKDFDVEFRLQIVPEITAGGINPCLAPSMKVIDFCHDTRTNLDIDLYVYSEKD